MLDCGLVVDCDTAAAVDGYCDCRAFACSQSPFESEFAKDLKFFEGIHGDLTNAASREHRVQTREFVGIVLVNLKPNVVGKNELEVGMREQ